MKWIISILILLLPQLVRAATITAASVNYADVNIAVNTTAARGDTVIIPDGNSTWTSTLNVTKGVTIKCTNSVGGVKITRTGGYALDIVPDSTALANGELIRIEKLYFDGGGAADTIIHVTGAGAAATKAFTNFCFVGNVISNANSSTTAGAFLLGGQVRGVIASNIFDRCHVILRTFGADVAAEFSNGNWPYAYGTVDQLFFEANTIKWTSSFSATDPGWVETGQGARLVMRYNVWNFSNVTDCGALLDVHGFQNGTETGTMSAEVYGNTFTNVVGAYQWMNFRGVQMLMFNNLGYGTVGGNDLTQYAGGCNEDWSGTYETEISNTYTWNNSDDGSESPFSENVDDCGIAENVNYWNYDATFDGTTGIGRGTSTPGGTCTTGVGYWKATTATPTTDPAVIQAGTFYKATATDTWTAYYTPFTFPHPLLGSVGVASISITNPATGTYAYPYVTNLSGVASSSTNFTAAGVTWTNTGHGTSGTASGTTNWLVSSNTLFAGDNVFVVSITDSNASTATANITLRYSTVPTQYIWPLGDSITYGGQDTEPVPGGYRYPLYVLLTNQNLIDPVYVGNSTENSTNAMPFNNHDGYGGYEIGEMDTNWIATLSHAPDYVLLLIGLNDYRHNTSITTATNRLEQLMSNIWINLPTTRIVIANLNCWTDLAPTNNAMEAYYNPYIQSIVNRQVGYGRNAVMADMRSPVLTDADLNADNTHPNVGGYSKIATGFLSAMFTNSAGNRSATVSGTFRAY